MISWQFLLVGSLAAVGAALAVGTGAALVRFHRTGSFPGREGGDVTRGQLVGLYLRVLIGAVIAVYGVVSLTRAGLL